MFFYKNCPDNNNNTLEIVKVSHFMRVYHLRSYDLFDEFVTYNYLTLCESVSDQFSSL